MSTLSSSVSYADGLWTYNYTISNNTILIDDFDILINGGGYYGLQPIPPPYTVPDQWIVKGAFSGSICNPPYNECGGFYQFYSQFDPTAASATTINFSFTTPYAPSTTTNNDFFIYGCQTFAPYTGCEVQSYGNVIVPDAADWLQFPIIVASPLPSAWSVMLVGLLLMGAIYARTNYLSKAAD